MVQEGHQGPHTALPLKLPTPAIYPLTQPRLLHLAESPPPSDRRRPVWISAKLLQGQDNEETPEDPAAERGKAAQRGTGCVSAGCGAKWAPL